ncbi:MAG: hypothetical protein EAZ11_04405 [Curvibacter sp.]|nr:MAG: hypothetical protein EAZ11_04405 [Curvibacter sp.]
MRRPSLPQRSGLCALAVALACTVSTAGAEEAHQEPFANTLWVNVGALSYHPNRSNGYNENNRGLGLEYRVRPDTSFIVGSFYNSVRHDSNYAAVNWQPVPLGDWKLGLSLGTMNGYPGVLNGDYFPVALPIATYEGKRFGVNFTVIPTLPQVDGALVVQLKFRLF